VKEEITTREERHAFICFDLFIKFCIVLFATEIAVSSGRAVYAVHLFIFSIFFNKISYFSTKKLKKNSRCRVFLNRRKQNIFWNFCSECNLSEGEGSCDGGVPLQRAGRNLEAKNRIRSRDLMYKSVDVNIPDQKLGAGQNLGVDRMLVAENRVN
jgi:hypothetical protein